MISVSDLQTIFFVELYPSETRKLVERLINYVIYKVSALTCGQLLINGRRKHDSFL